MGCKKDITSKRNKILSDRNTTLKVEKIMNWEQNNNKINWNHWNKNGKKPGFKNFTKCDLREIKSNKPKIGDQQEYI